MKITKLRRLGLNVVLNVVLELVPCIESCSVWRLTVDFQSYVLVTVASWYYLIYQM